MIQHLMSSKGSAPQFCYHVGDVVYFTGMKDEYYVSGVLAPPSLPSPDG
jgi:hypothetical protein